MDIIRAASACLLLAMGVALAQSDRGTITGTVTDPAGALMPGVRIEARNSETGALYQVASSSAGNYTIAQLPVGTYQISVSLPGFKPYLRGGIAVLASESVRIDIVMTMLASDEILTNDSIIQLVKAGIDEDAIISKVQESQHNFDLSVQGMVALKQGGVSDRLMRFLMNPTKPPEPKAAPPAATPVKSAVPQESPKPVEPPAAVATTAKTASTAATPTTASTAATAAPSPSLPGEIGVYFKRGEQWVEAQPEIVTYETGGMFARLATAGIIQNDVNGRIKGPHSRNAIQIPLEFLVVTAEGVTIKEYQLYRLHEQRDARKFLSVIGGIYSSGSATRDLLSFEGTKIAGRTFSVKLPKLDVGEYGFLLSGAASPNSKEGKMYTFRVIE